MKIVNYLRRIVIVGLACGAAGLCSFAPAQQPPAAVRIDQDPKAVTLRVGGRTVLDYQPAPSPMKPYLRQLFTPGGIQILRDAVKDHKHHHGLMFALAVDGVDFWGEEKLSGRELPRAVQDVRSSTVNGLSRAAFTQLLDWVSPKDVKLLEERRTIEVFAGPEIPPTLLTWRSRLQSPGKAVKLTGSHYFGLGMRFVESMDGEGRFFNSAGKEGPIVRGSERVSPAKWCAYTSQVDGKPVTVAIFDHPSNRRGAYFFTMRPFAYLAATINLWKEPLELKATETLDLRYGVAVWDGTIDAAEVEKQYRKWVEVEK